MPRYSVPLKAGKETRLPYAGKVFQIIDTGIDTSVRVQVEWGVDQQAIEDYGQCKNRFRIKGESSTDRFGAITLTSNIDTTVDMLASMQDVSASVVDGSTINANVLNAALAISAAQLPGALDGGRLAVTPARCNITQTIVAVTAASQAAIAANANRKYLAFMVVGSVDVTLVPDNAAVAGAGMVLQGQGVGKQGGSWTFEGSPPTDAFNVIAAGPGSQLIIWEGV